MRNVRNAHTVKSRKATVIAILRIQKFQLVRLTPWGWRSATARVSQGYVGWRPQWRYSLRGDAQKSPVLSWAYAMNAYRPAGTSARAGRESTIRSRVRGARATAKDPRGCARTRRRARPRRDAGPPTGGRAGWSR